MDFILTDIYLANEQQRVMKLYSKNKHFSFGNKEGFSQWWIKQLRHQNGECDYCKTPIGLIEELIDNKLLRAFKGRNGSIRGKFLEIDRIDHISNEYKEDNCVLICRYCNNDKSNIFQSEDFIRFLAPAKNAIFKYLKDQLMEKNR